jgi:hypothetical protein
MLAAVKEKDTCNGHEGRHGQNNGLKTSASFVEPSDIIHLKETLKQSCIKDYLSN